MGGKRTRRYCIDKWALIEDEAERVLGRVMSTRALLVAITAAMLMAASPARRPVWGQVLTPETVRRESFVQGVEAFFRYVDNKGRGYFTAADLTLTGYHIVYPPLPYPQAGAQAPFRC